ncbi:MAG: hypothetical protein ACYDAR_03805 [Thermomicrobiales bacterium]
MVPQVAFRRVVFALLSLLFALPAALVSAAMTYTVNVTTDTGAGAGTVDVVVTVGGTPGSPNPLSGGRPVVAGQGNPKPLPPSHP